MGTFRLNSDNAARRSAAEPILANPRGAAAALQPSVSPIARCIHERPFLASRRPVVAGGMTAPAGRRALAAGVAAARVAVGRWPAFPPPLSPGLALAAWALWLWAAWRWPQAWLFVLPA